MIIDTHTHVACGDDPRYPTVADRSIASRTSDWWRTGGTIDELIDTLDAHAVDKAVVVQAVGAYSYDCTCATHAVARYPDRTRFVTAIDMQAADPATTLHDLLTDPQTGHLISGVRLFGIGENKTMWLTDGRARTVWELAAAHGVTIVPCIFADRFIEVGELSQTTPAALVALDHCGFMDMVEGDSETMLMSLADIPSIHLKLSSYVLESAERTHHDPAPLIERIASRFGSDRMCWGSDHPQDQRSDYAGKLTLARKATRAFSESQRTDFFGATGGRLFFRESQLHRSFDSA
jgi:predicted TIM-barrel fold metal-dependent hydrolase